jgi:hypothetical protein
VPSNGMAIRPNYTLRRSDIANASIKKGATSGLTTTRPKSITPDTTGDQQSSKINRKAESTARMIIGSSQGSPLVSLSLGLLVLSYVIYGIVTGRAVGKGCSVERSKNPFFYWLVLILEFAFAAVFFYLFVQGV